MSASAYLIDAGPSRRGWSRLGSFLRCPQLFAYKYKLGATQVGDAGGEVALGGGNRDALVRGSLLHLALAHHYAERLPGTTTVVDGGLGRGVMQCPQGHGGTVSPGDATAYYRWADAIDVACSLRPEMTPFKDLVHETMRHYVRKWDDRDIEVVAVETELAAFLGTLDCPGHPDHEKPILYTQRIDLIARKDGRIVLFDHKSTARITKTTTAAYSVHGQFHGMHMLGGLHFQDYGGVVLNLVEWPVDGQCNLKRPLLEAAPGLTERFYTNARMAEHRIAQMEREGLGPWDWPKAMHEQVCFQRYGQCDALELCKWGRFG